MLKWLSFFLILVLAVACTSRRLEYQEASQLLSAPEPLVGIPEGVNFGNRYSLPSVTPNTYSYLPNKIGLLVPRPVAIFINEKEQEFDSVLLADRVSTDVSIIRRIKDSRGRQAIRTELPIEHVVLKLNDFLDSFATNYQRIDQKEYDMNECVIMYQINQREDPLFLCVQMTINNVYIAAQAEDADNHSLDDDASILLDSFAKNLFSN